MASVRSFWFEHRFELSGSLFAFGVFLVFIAILGYVPQARAWAATVSIFGRPTRVELEMTQVEKL